MEVIRQGETGGGESHLLDLVKGLLQSDIQCIVVAFSDGKMMEEMRRLGVDSYVFPSEKAFDCKVMKQIKTLVIKKDVQIIHAHGSRAASNSFWVANRLHIPFIYTVHGWSFHEGQNKLTYQLRALSEKLICSLSQKVICVSNDNAQTGVNTFGLDLKKTLVIENGIDTVRFCADYTEPIYQELNINKGDYVVAYIGRTTIQKDPINFIKGVALAYQNDNTIRGLLIGEGDMNKEIDTYLKDHHLEHIIQHLPFRHDIPQVLKSIQIYSLCSQWEGLSIGLLEAMAMSKAIIATPTDGTRTVIQSGYNGTLVPIGQPQALAKAILFYKTHPETATSHGINAKCLVKERFSSERVSAQVYSTYQSLYKE